MKNQNLLVREAVLAKVNSYSPYSKFRVGVAALLKDGTIIKGTNVENSSYGLSICAESACLFNVYSQGYTKDDVVGIAISSDNDDFVYPCGRCRQIMVELLNENISILLVNNKEEVKEVKLKRLLPYAFSGDDLNE